MSGWVIYEVEESEDARWDAAFEALPAQFGCQIEPDFGVLWIAELSEVEAVRMLMAFENDRIKSLGRGILVVPDCYRAEFLGRLSESTECRSGWTRLRRVHFATAIAREAFESVL